MTPDQFAALAKRAHSVTYTRVTTVKPSGERSCETTYHFDFDGAPDFGYNVNDDGELETMQ